MVLLLVISQPMAATGALCSRVAYCLPDQFVPSNSKNTMVATLHHPAHASFPIPSWTALAQVTGASSLGVGKLHRRHSSCMYSVLRSTFLENSVSQAGGLVIERRTGCNGSDSAVCLFGGLFGRKTAEDSTKPHIQFHDIAIPFPPSLLAESFLAGRELRCCYKASLDGFSAAQFHKYCDFKGPCVIVGRTSNGFQFGAFNPEGYRSTDDYYDTFDAFLFYWPAEGQPPIVLPKVGGSGAALFDYARGGPQFGADGLLIGPPRAPVMGGFAGPDTNSGGGELSEARSRLGLSYAVRADGKDSLFGEELNATLVEVEVYCCPAIAQLY